MARLTVLSVPPWLVADWWHMPPGLRLARSANVDGHRAGIACSVMDQTPGTTVRLWGVRVGC